ncbi:hypothetical protein SISNIDRAFT_491377 [Sistotremastrum niveocremeum HHB9708]|uniref:Uncharacterized protein n=1 Tax=Sistotremastrum niveocremeum HHB9708 TaxID=1314777 RepID=A0A164MVU3_9AGAM|nr:hypothetical protein SISNIDRAFT_491377 [Sistotremastrum niveocremeum HHB9708]
MLGKLEKAEEAKADDEVGSNHHDEEAESAPSDELVETPRSTWRTKTPSSRSVIRDRSVDSEDSVSTLRWRSISRRSRSHLSKTFTRDVSVESKDPPEKSLQLADLSCLPPVSLMPFAPVREASSHLPSDCIPGFTRRDNEEPLMLGGSQSSSGTRYVPHIGLSMKNVNRDHGASLPDQLDDEWTTLYGKFTRQDEETPDAPGITHIPPRGSASKSNQYGPEVEDVAGARGLQSEAILIDGHSADVPPTARQEEVDFMADVPLSVPHWYLLNTWNPLSSAAAVENVTLGLRGPSLTPPPLVKDVDAMDVDHESYIPRNVSSITGSSDSSRSVDVDVRIVSSDKDRSEIPGEDSISRIGSDEFTERASRKKNPGGNLTGVDAVKVIIVPDRPRRNTKAPKHPGMMDHSALIDRAFLEMCSSSPSVQEEVARGNKVRSTKLKSTPKGGTDDSADMSGLTSRDDLQGH